MLAPGQKADYVSPETCYYFFFFANTAESRDYTAQFNPLQTVNSPHDSYSGILTWLAGLNPSSLQYTDRMYRNEDRFIFNAPSELQTYSSLPCCDWD